jgi:hypothetical protein
MVLSERNFRSFLIKQRFLDEDHRRRNYPFIYEKRGETMQKVISKWLFKQTEEEKHNSQTDLKAILNNFNGKNKDLDNERDSPKLVNESA